MEYFCSISACRKKLTENELNYSKTLCYSHQKQNKKPEPTPAARRLGQLLENMGHKVEFEKYDGYKHIDIAIVKEKVNIEVDGDHHQGTEQALRDLKRTFYSWDKSYVTLRIPNSLTKEAVIEETAKYIDKFLKTSKAQLEKEIKGEYIQEGNPFWNDVTNFVNGVNKIINNVGNAVDSVSKTFNRVLKKF